MKAFGKAPTGNRLNRIHQSAHYRQGGFKNLVDTVLMAEGTSYLKLTYEFFTNKVMEPQQPLPVVKTDLKTLKSDGPVLIWFGHSSYFLKIDDFNILIDPVFNEMPSPFQSIGKKAFPMSYEYTVNDMPDQIDLVMITHDHYDHLGYHTIKQLKSRVKMFYTSLGVGAHLEYWGVNADKIVEFDWWEKRTFAHTIEITATPSRHFSGRLFKRNQTLWSSFVLKAATHKIFIGGDSGYDSTFKIIGEKFGPIDFAILECGQYDKKWPGIHMSPEEAAQASIDLKAKAFIPVHWGKFTLAMHSWNDPADRILKKADELGAVMTTPMIGEPVFLDKPLPLKRWWQNF